MHKLIGNTDIHMQDYIFFNKFAYIRCDAPWFFSRWTITPLLEIKDIFPLYVTTMP